MPRPKLYHSKAERQEANRVKNKRFYKKHCKDILLYKQEKRDAENRTIEIQRTQTRKKRQIERDSERKEKTSPIPIRALEKKAPKDPMSMLSTNLKLCISELELKLEEHKQEHRELVDSEPGKYVETLCKQAVQWKQASRRSFMQRPTYRNPLSTARSLFERKLSEYQLMEDDYFYAIRDQMGQFWDERRGEFAIYKEVVTELIGVLKSLEDVVDKAGVTLELADLSDIYHTNHSSEKAALARDAKKRKRDRAKAHQRRLDAQRKLDNRMAGLEDDDEDRSKDVELFQRDAQYYERHLRVLRTTLQRELNNDPRQYLENLYQELILWKAAKRPVVSPLDHPLLILQSLESSTQKIWRQLRATVGDIPLTEKYCHLHHAVLHICHCVGDLHVALLEEDMMADVDEAELSRYMTLEDRYGTRRLKLFDAAMQHKYDLAGL
ncbi:hypothetical protein PQX77_011589 [Marasmius sp. AFHP31]|nr:hypothetical protein PQX77_018849 [Marasmius sp. AFHP31]KAK1225476.1 hypothetical protein PQX77_011589 [Marasmius sp. AFHP31]